VLVVAHQANVLRNMDKVLLLKEGRVAAFGERDKVLQSLMRRPQTQVAEPQRTLGGSVPNLIGKA